jgi:hypothetical protein
VQTYAQTSVKGIICAQTFRQTIVTNSRTCKHTSWQVKKSRVDKILMRRITTEVFILLSAVNILPNPIPNIVRVHFPIMSVLLPNIVGVLRLIWVFKHHNLFAKDQ